MHCRGAVITDLTLSVAAHKAKHAKNVIRFLTCGLVKKIWFILAKYFISIRLYTRIAKYIDLNH
jgi:hypothetical protein